MTATDRDPLTLPAITRHYLRGLRCGQIDTTPAAFTGAEECDAEYRERLRAAYQGIWGDLGSALVRAREKRRVRWEGGGG